MSRAVKRKDYPLSMRLPEAENSRSVGTPRSSRTWKGTRSSRSSSTARRTRQREGYSNTLATFRSER